MASLRLEGNLNLFLVLPSLLVSVLVVLVVKFLWQYQNLRATFNKIPGPKDVFLLGNLLQIPRTSHLAFKQSQRWFAKYKGLLRVWHGPSPIVAASTPEGAELVLGGTKHLSKGLTYKFLHSWLGIGLLTSTGNKWKSRRKLITPTFHYQILNNFLHIFEEQSEVLVEQLQANVDAEPFDIFPYIGKCALDIICETSMGKSVNAQKNKDSEYVRAVLRISELITRRIRSPWLWPEFLYSLTSSGREHNKCLQILHGFTNKVIDEKIQESKSKAKKDNPEDAIDDTHGTRRRKKKLAFLDLLVECFEKGTIDREGIREEVDTFMFEGHDTTTSGINWALYLLGSHPEIQDKLYDEVEQFCASPREGLTVDDLKGLRFLECVIKESLRIFPPVPGYSRTLSEDVTISGYFVPKGQLLGISSAAIHRNPDIWPEPLKFDPDRFLPENSENRHPYAFIPFSAGPRNCIGQRFALLEEKVVLLNIIRHFRVESTQSFDELNPCAELILRPKDGIIVKLRPRN